MISISLGPSRDPHKQQKFGPYEPISFYDFTRTICQNIWSPIIWADGIRAKRQFKSASYVVLDFDLGRPTIAEIVAEMEELKLRYIVATTKSHQKEKVTLAGVKSPAVDRYRLVLRASEITSAELFEYNMKQYAKWFGSDPSCTDAGRFYYPSVNVVASSVKAGDAIVQWQPFDEDYEPESEKYARRAHRLEAHGRAGTMPRWMTDILDGREIVPEGGRHTKCVAIGAQMARMGVDEHKIVAMLLKTRLADIGEPDVRRAVRNGIKSELGG